MKAETIANLALAIGGIIIGASLIAFGAFLGGTVVWLIWPYAVPAAFPGLVASGAIAAKLPWWSSVCLTWLFSILLKATMKQPDRKKKEAKDELKDESMPNLANRLTGVKINK